ncbi:MAG TPA: hypothetical protein VLW53_04960 [Candidatus Eisenbacteria bacterium]|nr:hypothetical protein [Candidatus Eisenbacteria bacterium]
MITRLLTAVAGVAACALSLVPGRPAVVAVGVVAAVAVVAAAVLGRRWLGLAATLLATGAVLLAAATGASDIGAAQLVVTSALLLAFVTGLDTTRPAPRAVRADTITTAGLGRRAAVPAVALAASAAVAVIAERPVEPSVWLVLLGLAAGVGALLAATRLF